MCKYFPDLKNTDVQAFGGLTTQRLKWKIEQGHFNLDQYCNIIIHVGTNDVFHISSDIFYENMVSVVQEILRLNRACKVILSSILPRPVDYKFSDILIREFNLKLADYAVSHSDRVVYMPVCKSFYCRFGRPVFPLFLKTDRLHLNHADIQKFVHFIANFLAHLY